MHVLLQGCTTGDNASFQFSGEWTIDSYSLFSQVDGTVINDQTYTDAGSFVFSSNGSGFATLNIPGSSLPPGQPIDWDYDSGNSELSVNYGTGQDTFIYQTTIQSQDQVILISNMPVTSETSTGFTKTTMELSRNR
jgi:hypothetical protein